MPPAIDKVTAFITRTTSQDGWLAYLPRLWGSRPGQTCLTLTRSTTR